KAAVGLELRNVHAGYLPSVGLQLQRGALAGSNNLDRIINPNGDWFSYGSLGLSLNWSVFDSFTKRYQAQQKRIEMIKVDNNIADFNQAINLQVMQTSASMRTNYESMKLQEENLELSEEVLRVSRL